MTRIETALRQLVGDAAAAGAAFALIGGFAVSARAEPRFTRDVDLAVAAVDDAAVEALIQVLTARGYRLVSTVEQTAARRLATARLISPAAPDEDLLVDLLFASSGVEPEIVAAAEPLEVLTGLVIPVAHTGHLLALKLLARDDDTRPQDAADLRALLAVANPAEIDLARDTVALIHDRGFARGRDLIAALDALVAQ